MIKILFLYQNNTKINKCKTCHYLITYTTKITDKCSNNKSPWQYSQGRSRGQSAGIAKTEGHAELCNEYLISKTQAEGNHRSNSFAYFTETQSSLCLIPIYMNCSFHGLVKEWQSLNNTVHISVTMIYYE